MNKKICAFTGHRPAQIPGGELESSPAFSALYAAIKASIRQAIAQGFTVFRSGGAMGADLWCAQAVLELRRQYPRIRLHFILPCETQANHWPEAWRQRYFDLLSQADEVTYVQARYSRGCMLRRNRALLEGAALVIACYNGQERGGTAYTVRYARHRGVPVRNVLALPEADT